MTPFVLLTNQTRERQRPPLFRQRATADLIARLVPNRIPKRKPIPRKPQPVTVPDATTERKPGRRSPLAQAPVNGFRFSSGLVQRGLTTQSVNGRSMPTNGHGKEVFSIDVNDRPAAVPEKVTPVVVHNTQAPQKNNEASPAIPTAAEKPAKMQPQSQTPKPGLRQLLDQNSQLPAQAVILGVCDDGLPLAFDLWDPNPGSLLAMGDMREEQIQLLQMALASVAIRNSPRAAQFLVFSHQPEVWTDWVTRQGFDRHCLAIVEAQDDAASEWIIRLADWTEQRRMGQRNGPPVILVIDTLTFLPRLAYDIRLNFDWLVKEGPAAQIWTMAAISTDLATSLGHRMLRAFQSRIFGCAKDATVFSRLPGFNEQQAGSLSQPGRFTVQVGENWLQFQLPAF